MATITLAREERGEAQVPLAQALFIVPQAHYRIFDTRFQIEMYELFHRHAVTRTLHALCTPVLVVLSFAGLWRLPAPVAVAFALAMIGYHLRAERVAGALTAVLVAGALAIGWTLRGAPGGVVAAAALAAGLVQMASHAAEPIPPPWSGSYAFVPTATFLRSAPVGRLVVMFLLSLLVFVFLEIWAAPRVWGIQVLHALMRFGYRDDLRRDVDGRVESMLTDSRNGWPGQAGLSAPGEASS